MKASAQQFTARLISLPTAIVMIASVALMATTYVQTRLHAPVNKERLKALEGVADRDVTQLPALEEERERQRDASLERARWATIETNVLIVAAVLFLIGSKWSISLKDRPLPGLSTIMAQRATPASASRKQKRRSRANDVCGTDFPVGQKTGSKACPTREPRVSTRANPAQPEALTFVDETIRKHGRGRKALIPILQAIQSHERYLPEGMLKQVCERTQITPARMIGVSSFYKQFRRSPVGERIVHVCRGTACHVAGARVMSDAIRRAVGIDADADTDPQRRFTIEEVACLGCCTLAPVVRIDEVTYGHLSPDMVPEMLNDCLTAARNGTSTGGKAIAPAGFAPDDARDSLGEIRIGLGSCCVAGGSGKVYDALERAVLATGARVTVKRVGCVGMCHQTPLVDVVLPGRPSALYTGVGPEDAKAIVRRHFRPAGIGRRVAHTASSWLENIVHDGRQGSITRRPMEARDPPIASFLGRQTHIATEHFGRLDPTDLDEYLLHDGFKALRKCVKDLSPQEVIEEVQRSGLRGRGGAGFPTGVKWSEVRQAGVGPTFQSVNRQAGKPVPHAAADGMGTYVICNGDEGDPGAFMDRMLMESFPYRIIEGMTIAAYAIGATEGYFYVRAEYPLAVRRLRDALRACENRGLLEENILGSGLCLRLEIMEGAGAFVCGEETALIASIEGNRGSPTLRPPYPADRGLWGRPTLVNNVETYATVPWIMRNGAEALATLGTSTSKGTKVFALAGKINRGGLIEVPMGITIREIVSEIGGGIRKGGRFKAVQIGGPSGGCIPAARADTPVDYEALAKVGAIMGSGGLVVLDESDCMVDIARYFLAFTQDQSCGKCTFCRIGTRRMLDILNRLCAGDGRDGDLDMLERLAHTIRGGSLCGLGKTAPNPVLSTLRYFRDEYEAHLQGRCPAGKCRELITYRVTDDCIGCTLCAQNCPVEAIHFAPYQRHEIDADECTRFDMCRIKCPEHAIEIV